MPYYELMGSCGKRSYLNVAYFVITEKRGEGRDSVRSLSRDEITSTYVSANHE